MPMIDLDSMLAELDRRIAKEKGLRKRILLEAARKNLRDYERLT